MNKKGFTLIELLMVVGVIAALAVGVIVVINPGQQFAQMRDNTRESHVNTIYNGLKGYQIDNWGSLEGLEISEEVVEICNTNELDPVNCDELVDLSPLIDQGYINTIPVDSQAEGGGTGYKISKGYKTGDICVQAPLTERGEKISIGVCLDGPFVDVYTIPENSLARYKPDGTEVWTRELDEEEWTRSVITDSNNNAYVGTQTSVFKVDENNNVIWEYDTELEDVWSNFPRHLDLSSSEEELHIGTQEKYYKIDLTNAPTDGSIFSDEVIWTFDVSDTIQQSAVYSDNEIYLLTENEDSEFRVYKLDLTNAPTDGSIFSDYEWVFDEVESGDDWGSALTVSNDNNIYFSARGTVLHKLDSDGNLIWANNELSGIFDVSIQEIGINSAGNIIAIDDYSLVGFYSSQGDLLEITTDIGFLWWQTFGSDIDKHDYYHISGVDGGEVFVIDARDIKSRHRNKEFVGEAADGTEYSLFHSPVDGGEEVIIHGNEGEEYTDGFVIDYESGVITFDDYPNELYNLGQWDPVLVSYAKEGEALPRLLFVSNFELPGGSNGIAAFK